MSEDYKFDNKNKPQMNADERRCGVDLFGSLGKGMLAKELKRTKTNSDTVSSYGVRTSSLLNNSYQYAQNTEMSNSSGLATLHPFDEITSIKRKNVSLIEGFSDNEGLETLKNYSGLTPLNFDSKPQIMAPRVTPLEGVSTYALRGIGVRGVENPQGFGIDEHRYSPQRTLRTQSPVITNFCYKGE